MPTEEQTSIPSNFAVRGVNFDRFGQVLPQMVSRIITHLAFYLSDYNVPWSGNITYEIRDWDDKSLLYSGVALNGNQLTGTPTLYEHELSTPLTVSNKRPWIGVQSLGGVNSGTFVWYDVNEQKAGEYNAYQQSPGSGGAWGGVNPVGDCGYRYTYLDLPSLTVDAATSVDDDEATLNGTLDDDGGEACDCGFEWGETTAYGNTTPTQSRTTGQTFAQTISGLDPNKTYHFRAFATNAAATTYGANRTFTTAAAAPIVVNNPATDITHVAAALNGTLDDDGGEACDCGFEWGLTVAYGNTTPTQSKMAGQTFSQLISGLALNTLYHFRAFAINSWGTSHGADGTLQTLASAPTVTTDAATSRAAISANLNGTLDNDIGEACRCGFEWGLDTGYGTITPTESKITGETFSQEIGGLYPGTTYHFRAFAINSLGRSYGADRSFASAEVIRSAYALARREL